MEFTNEIKTRKVLYLYSASVPKQSGTGTETTLLEPKFSDTITMIKSDSLKNILICRLKLFLEMVLGLVILELYV